MSGIYNTISCGELNSKKIECESQLKIKTNDKVPLLITNEDNDVLFSITDSGIVFNKNDATSFLSLSDTPSDYTDGILKVQGDKIIIEPPRQIVKETKLVNEEIKTKQLTTDTIMTDKIKMTQIDCDTAHIENLKINNAHITDLQNDKITSKLLNCNEGTLNIAITNQLKSKDIKCDKIMTTEILSNSLETTEATLKTLECDEIKSEEIATKTLRCDQIDCPIFNVTEIQYGSLEKPLQLVITQQKSIDYEPCDHMYIYTKVIKGIIKQQFKILGCPRDKLLFIKSVTAVGNDIKFNYNICREEDEYIVSFYYDKRVDVDCKLAILIN